MAKSKNDEAGSDRRVEKDRRAGNQRRNQQVAVVEERRKDDRRKSPRRRQIDPTTCERDYSAEEIEFMQALDEYKRASGRMFPTCSEILEVIKAMGYERAPSTGETSDAPASDSAVQSEGPETGG